MVMVSCRLPSGWLSYSFTQLHTSWPRSLVTNLATRVTSFRHELEKGNKVFEFIHNYFLSSFLRKSQFFCASVLKSLIASLYVRVAILDKAVMDEFFHYTRMTI